MNLFSKRKYYPSLIVSQEKIQVIRLDESGKNVSHLAEERLDPKVIEAGEVRDVAKLALSLRKLFGEAKISEPAVVVGVPENKCYTKILELPKLRLDELAEAVSWEADTYLPIDSDSVYMDWKIIEEGAKDSVAVLLIAVPKELIDGYSAALKEAGLTPVAFATTALSLVRLVEKENLRSLIAEVQEKHAVLTLSRGKAIEASSIVNFSNVAEEETESLVQTIKKMIAYYEEKKGKERVQKIYLCGERVSDKLRDVIKKGTDREVQFAPLLAGNFPKGKEMSFAVAASLAKTDIQAPRDEYTINLLPPEIQEQLEKTANRKINRRLLTASTALTTSLAAASLIAFLGLRSLNANLQKEKLQAPQPPPEIGQMIQETQHLNRLANTVVHAAPLRVFPQARLAAVIDNLPEGIQIVLVRIDEKKKTIQITGKALDRANLLAFRDNLDRAAGISDAVLPLASLQQPVNIEFTLSAKLD